MIKITTKKVIIILNPNNSTCDEYRIKHMGK